MRMRVTTGRAALLAAGLLFPVLAAGEESRFEKALRLDPGGRFSIRTDLGGVTVTGVNAPGARIVITSRRPIDDLLRLTFREDAGSVTVTGRRVRGHFFPWIGERGNVRFEIQVPAQTELDVDTSGGAIKISGLSSPAKLETSGGGIRVSVDPTVGLRIDASGNSVRAEIPITVQGSISRGKLQGNMGGGGELLRLHTSGGGVQIQGL